MLCKTVSIGLESQNLSVGVLISYSLSVVEAAHPMRTRGLPTFSEFDLGQVIGFQLPFL